MPKPALHKKRSKRRPRIVVRSQSGDQLDKPFRFIFGASVTYQLERVKCGKPKCRKWHGPYWYAYWAAAGRTRTLYIGKELRPAAAVSDALVKRRVAQIDAAIAERAAAAALEQTGEEK